MSIATSLLKGAIAGAVATWLMGKVTTRLYERESAATRAREDRARGEKAAYTVAVEKAARLARREVEAERAEELGRGVHWGLGVAAGAVYGALRPRSRVLRAGRGLAFGLAFFVLFDEVLNWALRLTPGPGAFPWQTHARGLAGHAAFGLTADAALRAMDRR